MTNTMTNKLVLSLFPNIGLLDAAFEDAGYCIVRGPDKIWGGDIRKFTPPLGVFEGIIGGPPCQDFSTARRAIPPTGDGLAMLAQYQRCIEQAQPQWWLMENVPGVPDVKITGYNWQRIIISARDVGMTQKRLRHIQFGSRDKTVLVRHPTAAPIPGPVTPTICASDHNTPWADFCTGQGLPPDYDIPAFTRVALRRAVGNGVPYPMAQALAQMVKSRQPEGTVKLCGCHCGQPVSKRATYHNGACRMRVARRRQTACSRTEPHHRHPKSQPIHLYTTLLNSNLAGSGET